MTAAVEGALGRVHLNRPQALNSLTHEMIGLIDAGPDRLTADPSVRAISLTGEGERALCAGGDIKMLWSSGRSELDRAMAFWSDEYCLNARIHRLKTPWVAVMDGICMGGGVGLSTHGRYRVVTERTRFAMPETGIGYFSDVGGTFALSRAPHGFGTWLGLTGATVGPADVIAAGLADAMVLSSAVPVLLSDLAAGVAPGHAIAAQTFDPGSSLLQAHAALIETAFAAGDIAGIFAALRADGSDFAKQTLDLLRAKSPTSLVLTLHLLRQAATLPDLETCLDHELSADALILKGDDFYEGVRAAVIDKDSKPAWSPATLDAVGCDTLIGGFRTLPTVSDSKRKTT